MDTPTLKAKVKMLEKETKQYSTKGLSLDFEDVISYWKIYIYISVAIFLLLIIFRPKFIYTSRIETNPNGSQQNKLKIDYKKFIVYWLIFSLISCIGFFFYKTKSS
jgi:hypothetical protein